MTSGPPEAPSLASVGRSAALLTAGTLAAQATIVVRELFLAAQVGLSSALDALLIGITLPVALAGVLATGLATALVPAYVAAARQGGPGDARALSGAVLVWAGAAALSLWIIVSMFAPQIVDVIGSGLAPEDKVDATGYLRIVAPVILTTTLTMILLAVCQAERYFLPIAASTVGTAATSLVVMLLLWDALGLSSYAVGSLVGPLVGLVIALAATVRRSITPRLGVRTHGLGLVALLKHALPLTVSSSVLQLGVVANRAVASMLGPGAVSAVRYGELLVSVPIGAIGPAWGQAIYPTLVQTTQSPDSDALAATVTRALRFTLAAFIPIAALTAAVAPVVVSVAFGRGAVTGEQLELTARVVLCLSPVIITSMASPVLTGALNARRRANVLLATGVLNVSTNLVLNFVLGMTIGAPGIALATSIASGAATLFLAWRLSLVDERFRPRALGRPLAIGIIAVAPAVLVIGGLAWAVGGFQDLVSGVAFLSLAGGLGIVSYMLLATRLGSVEVGELWRSVTGYMSSVRKRRVAT